MPDQQPDAAPTQYPPTPEGDYRKAADEIRAKLDSTEDNTTNAAWRIATARRLADLAIRMTAAQHGAGLAAVEPQSDEQPQQRARQ